jgi:phosphate/sulfate permease
LWKGNYLVPRLLKVALAVLLASFVLLQLLWLGGAPFSNSQDGVDAFFGFFIIINLMVLSAFNRIRFYVTDRRIVLTADWYIVKSIKNNGNTN